MTIQIKSQSDLRRGAIAGLLAAFLFGLSTPFSKMLLGDIQPQLLAGLLYLGSGIVLSTSLLFLRSKRPKLSRKDILPLGSAVFFGGMLAPVLLLFGLSKTMASTASLLLNLEGVLTALLAWFVFGERFNRRIGAGMALIALGGLCLSWQGTPDLKDLLGPLLIVAACVSWALDNNFTRKVSFSDAVQVAAIKGMCAGIANTLCAFALGATFPSVFLIAESMILGFFSYGLSLVAFVIGLRLVGSARTGAYFSIAPFIGAAVSLLFGDKGTWGLLAAALFMASGVYLHLTESIKTALSQD